MSLPLGCGEAIYSMWVGCLKGVGKAVCRGRGGYLDGVGRMSGGFRWLSGGCLEGVGRLSDVCVCVWRLSRRYG